MKKIIILFTVVLFLVLIWILFFRNKTETPDKNSSSANTKIFSLYIAKEKAIGNILRLPAQLSAYQSVNIYPKVTGYIKNISVDIGMEVKQGQMLMEMEAPEVEQNSLAAHERYLKAQASFNASKDSYYRLLSTNKTAGAVSPNELQSAESKMQSDSALCNSEKANWMAMQSLKDYLIVRSPFEGTITQRNIHPGALVTVGNKMDLKPMLELQQISKLRLQVKVPENFATQLEKDQKVSFVVDALPGKTFAGIISRMANSLDEKYRSESVEIDVLNTDKILMPGMYAEVLLPLKGHLNTCIVPQSAVITSTEKKYIIKVKNQKAVWVDVTTGNEDKGMVEIFGVVNAGDSIVSDASESIKDGQVVNVK